MPRKVYSLNIKVENAAYNPSLSRNTHVHLRLLHTTAGEVQKLICWLIKIISTCESVTHCQVLFEVTSRREMELQISKLNETELERFPRKPKNGVLPHHSKPDFH